MSSLLFSLRCQHVSGLAVPSSISVKATDTGVAKEVLRKKCCERDVAKKVLRRWCCERCVAKEVLEESSKLTRYTICDDVMSLT